MIDSLRPDRGITLDPSGLNSFSDWVLLVPTGDDALVDPALDGQTRFDGTRAVHQWNSGGVPSSVGATQLEMCMGMGTIGIPCVLWDFHGNGSDNDYIMGIGMGVGIKVWEWEYSRAMGMGMNSHCSFSTYHNYEILFSNTWSGKAKPI